MNDAVLLRLGPEDADNEVAQQFHLAADSGPAEPVVTLWWDLAT